VVKVSTVSHLFVPGVMNFIRLDISFAYLRSRLVAVGTRGFSFIVPPTNRLAWLSIGFRIGSGRLGGAPGSVPAENLSTPGVPDKGGTEPSSTKNPANTCFVFMEADFKMDFALWRACTEILDDQDSRKLGPGGWGAMKTVSHFLSPRQ
jgi:hypothetical protein